MEFPCTNKCLVYASCNKLCMPYRDYVQEAYRQEKYHCFKIIPSIPKQIRELAILMNRVHDGEYLVQYIPSSDLLMISHVHMEMITSLITNVRKRKDVYSYHSFPNELKGDIDGTNIKNYS